MAIALDRSRAVMRHARWMALPIILVAFAAPSTATAQIVNVQPMLAGPPRQGASLTAEGTADWRAGNTNLLLIGGSLVGRYLHGRHLVFFLAKGEFGIKSDARFSNHDLEHLRYRLAVTGPLFGEIFVQHDQDEFRRLALRALWGAGPRVELKFSGPMEIAAGVSYMMETERLQQGPWPDSGDNRLNHRLSSYAGITVHVAKRVKLGHTLYVQPRLDLFEDLRVLQETEFLLSANDMLAVKLSLTLAYDSAPPAGVNPIDAIRKASLQVSF